MTNEEILKKVIEKAVGNGCKIPDEIRPQYEVKGWDVNMNWMKFQIIFSHSFAKAFWGEKGTLVGKWDGNKKQYIPSYIKVWQFHLQQMVLEKEPLKYLEKYIKEG